MKEFMRWLLRSPQFFADKLRHVLLAEYARADGVVKVVIYVGYAVAQTHGDGLERVVLRAVGVVEYAHSRLVAEVQPPPVALEYVHDAQALLIVLEAAGIYAVERPLPCVAEGRMPQIVAQRDGLRQILVQLQRPRHGAGKAADLQRVRESGAVMVALGLQKDLSLVL